MQQFVKSNIAYLLWFLVYFILAWAILGGTQESFLIALLIYAVSIGIALSPIGESILREIEHVRPLATQEEKEYLEPLFEEVYDAALEENPKLNREIKLHMIDEMYVNAFAIGRKTIAVTKGAVNTFSEAELQGVLAHELGHITYGHTKALLLSTIGNLFFSVIVMLIRAIMSIVEFIGLLISKSSWGIILTKSLTWLARFPFEVCLFLFIYLGNIILSLNSRYNELQADAFAYQCGFGEELVSSLYLLQKIALNETMTWKEKLTASHPHTAKRIEALEQKLEEEN